MKTNKTTELLLKRNFYKTRIFIILLGTLLMFHAFYFSDKPVTLETIFENINKPEIYLALIFAFICSFSISYTIGIFNKENVKKMTTKKSKGISKYPKFKFYSKTRFYIFRIYSISLITFTLFYGVYYMLIQDILGQFIQGNLVIFFCLLSALGISLFIHYYIGFFNKENIRKITTQEEDKKKGISHL